jgi:hypothetical protein
MAPGALHVLEIAIGAAPMRRATLSSIVVGRQDLVRSAFLNEDAADWITVPLLSTAALLLGLLALYRARPWNIHGVAAFHRRDKWQKLGVLDVDETTADVLKLLPHC